MPSVTERVDPRVRRTQEAIRNAFKRLVSERGLVPLTVQDIAAQAGVKRATFYAHYGSKHDLFAQLIQESFDAALTARLERPLRLEPGELRRLLLAVCSFMAQVHAGCHVHDDEMEVQIKRQVQQHLTDWLLEALERCVQAPNARLVSRQMAATLTASTLYAAAAAWSGDREGEPPSSYISEAMVFLLGGIEACGFRLIR